MKKNKKIKIGKKLPVKKFEIKKEAPVVIWIFQISVALVLAAVTAIFFFQSISMQESSMEPTFQIREKFFVNKVVYKFKSPKRGDVIAFTKDGKDNAAVHIKRIVGLPGENIRIKDGKIYIDGEEYKENKSFSDITNPGLAAEGVNLKKDEYFVLGDNRNNSEDSRFAEVKNVQKKYIEGKLWFRSGPFDKMGFIKD